MCSYCGCSSVACIGRFMAEHEDLVNAMGVLRRAALAHQPSAVVAAVDGLTGLLRPHTHAEEVGLFAVMRQDPEFTEHIDLLCAEHGSLDRQLAAVRGGEFGLVPRLELALRAHIDREDNGLFPAAAIALAGPEWDTVHELTPPA